MERSDELTAQAIASAYYDKRYSGWGLRFHTEVIKWMMEGIWADTHVLDAGCGTGIIGQMHPNHYIMGVDLSPEMVAQCPRDLEHQRYYIGSVTEPHEVGWPHHAMGAVVCRSLLHHLPDHKAALKVFHNALKPGGRLVLWETNKGWLAQQVRRRTQHGDRFSEYHHAFGPGELEADLKEAGFVVDEIRYMGFTAYPLFGFPDIIDLAPFIPFKPLVYRAAQALDTALSGVPGVNRMAWAVGIKAHKA